MIMWMEGALAETVGLQSTIIFLVVVLLGLFWIRLPKNLPPGPTGLPGIGSALALRSCAPYLRFTEWSKKYGGVFSVRLGHSLLVVLNDIQHIKEALHKQADDFSDRFQNAIAVDLGIEGSFLFENGYNWKARRRFGLGALRSFGMGKKSIEHSINEESRYLLDWFADQEGKTFDPAHLVNNAVSNIICKLCFGYRFNYSDPKFTELIARTREHVSSIGPRNLVNVFSWIIHTPLYARVRETNQFLKDFLFGIVKDHRQSYDKNDIRDIIDMYFTEVDNLTDSGKIEENAFSDRALSRSILDLFLAGTDTTTNSLMWSLMYMAINHDVQNMVQSEIDDVIGVSRQPSMADSPNMPNTNAAILEILRMRPVAPLAVPHQTSEDTTLDGYMIPKGTRVLVNIWAVHHDPATWTEPEKYNPARFLSADGKSVVQHESFIPFGTGRRVCLGEKLAKSELFLFFVNMLQQFTFTFPEGKPIPSQEGSKGFILSPDPYKILATRRS